MQNYTQRSKPTKYIIQQKEERQRKCFSLPIMPPKTPCVPIKMQRRQTTRPLRTQAKYGVTGGIFALFSLCRNNRLNTAGSHVFTLPVGRVRASQTAGRRQSRPLPLLRVATRPLAHFAASDKSFAFWAVATFPQKALAFRGPRIRAEALHPLLETEYDMKNKKMSIRISEQDLAAIHRKANTAKLSVTDYVTRSCLNKQIVVVDGLENIIREQKAIGKNLNRLTLLCNMGRVSVADLSEVKNEYARLNEFLCSLLDRRWWQ